MCHTIAAPGDSGVASTARGKVLKYQDMAKKLWKMWQVKVKVIKVMVDL